MQSETKIKILVVDDDDSHRKMLEAVLSSESYNIHMAEHGQKAVELVKQNFFDLILMDIRMKKMDGIQAMKKIKAINPEIPIIMMTAYGSVNTAIDALKSGANDYLIKPLDIEELKILIVKTLKQHQLEKENKFLKERIKEKFNFTNIIGKSEPMQKLFETISLAAPTDATILIQGESGTGKELIANAIHENSLRSNEPFIKVNCAALPETLLESELFGYAKGAFTGALKTKKGRFLLAHKGSIMLDEIAEITIATQTKLLRVLQEQEFELVGGTKSIKIDTRVIAATNKNLLEEIKNNKFREDLYYRLNVVSIEVPPLRKRKDDIAILTDFFLKKYAKKNKRLIHSITPESIDLLMKYEWPGNIRELENVIERTVILTRENIITPENLPKSIKDSSNIPIKNQDVSEGKSLKEIEKNIILKTLEENNENRTHTAKVLGISRRTLQLKIKEYSNS